MKVQFNVSKLATLANSFFQPSWSLQALGKLVMNEWMSAFTYRFHCVLPYTQSTLQSYGGGYLSSTTTIKHAQSIKKLCLTFKFRNLIRASSWWVFACFQAGWSTGVIMPLTFSRSVVVVTEQSWKNNHLSQDYENIYSRQKNYRILFKSVNSKMNTYI